jgi:hypothetical protein
MFLVDELKEFLPILSVRRSTLLQDPIYGQGRIRRRCNQ